MASNTSATNMTGQGKTKFENLREEYLSDWTKLPFQSTFDTFVTTIPSGYGKYEQKESNIFKKGDTISLYLQPVCYSNGFT